MLATTLQSILTTLNGHVDGRVGEIEIVSIKSTGKDGEGADLTPNVWVKVDFTAFCSAFGGQTGAHITSTPGQGKVEWTATVGGILYKATETIESPADPTVPTLPA